MEEGIYEQLITKTVNSKLTELGETQFYIQKNEIDKAEAAFIISQHLHKVIRYSLNTLKGDDVLERQISLANTIIQGIIEFLPKEEIENDIIEIQGNILKGIFKKMDANFADVKKHLQTITPSSRLIQSQLFTGGSSDVSLESELRKEILSSNEVDLLVSFIKWKGINILQNALTEFTNRGGHLRVITTTYMGASDSKAIAFLSKLPNTKIKVSYNTGNERLHAKAYLFKRNTGFDTGYIGSSNFSRSALTDGLEWNLKVTTKEVSHIIDKFKKTFDTYWSNTEFETFEEKRDSEKLIRALKGAKNFSGSLDINTFFDLKPYPYQEEILESLEVERTVHNRFKNLIVAATGTGKTIISSFDYKQFKKNNNSAKLLFLAHRTEILTQSLHTFRAVLKDNNFGERWIGEEEPSNYEHVFASVQTLKNRIKTFDLSEDYYDFIIVDEVHHISASSYRPILNYFKPKVLIGLTATPERMDNADILEDFGNRIAAEIRLPEALNRKLLCPFQYFGISDSIDLTNVKWENGRYDKNELSELYLSSKHRVGEIIDNLKKYIKDERDARSLCFCVSIKHAEFMAAKFTEAGFKAKALSSNNTNDRTFLKSKLSKGEINYLFVVDIFNEGVDIPEIDTVLFLRPTESLTVFLQQLGRGLRLAENKDCLTVLDFVGNAKPEYNFENKFRALIGKTNTSVAKEVENDFPHLPLGCSIILEKKAKKVILQNIISSNKVRRVGIINKIRTFKHDTNLPLSLKNFLQLYNIPLEHIYKYDSWKWLCHEAGELESMSEVNLKPIRTAIGKKWLSTKSNSYFNFILKLAKNGFILNDKVLSAEEKAMLLMLHYDVWQKEKGFDSLEKSITQIGENPILVEEIIEVLEILIDRIKFKEIKIDLPFKQPLKVHSRYTRDQILAAFSFSSFDKKSSNREGVAENKLLNVELIFIDLIKSEEDFSPTTMYDDYAISPNLFHWQSQNSARRDIGKGLSYIQHESNGKTLLLFVREKSKNEYKNTNGYVFIGEMIYQKSNGSKPMNITCSLKEPMPNYLWKQAAKMSID